MTSGGSTPISGEEWECIKNTFTEASEHGLQYEWLQWFIGGLHIDKKEIIEAANDAAIEWDF